jgi:hypothetical protein
MSQAGTKEADPEVLYRGGMAAELELGTRRFRHFLRYVKVLEPPPGRGIIQFERWPQLMEACRVLEEARLVMWVNSRQIGASWLLAALATWTAQYQRAPAVAN